MATTMAWDPGQYLRRRDERARPFADLLARTPVHNPASVVDLGCGPGHLTAELAERWPQAAVLGLDSSPQMIAQARRLLADRVPAQAGGTSSDGTSADHDARQPAGRPGPGRLRFQLGDLRAWRPEHPVDLVVCNAALHWVPDHLELLPSLVASLAPGGALAIQAPGNFAEPSHRLLAELARSPRWRDRLGHVPREQPTHPARVYLDRLCRLGCHVDAWETTYLHVLTGPDPVLDWMRGTALRPYLGALDPAGAADFTAEYGAALRAAYPEADYGTLLPFRRVFAVAQKRPGAR